MVARFFVLFEKKLLTIYYLYNSIRAVATAGHLAVGYKHPILGIT
jgi:hypothetical protein